MSMQRIFMILARLGYKIDLDSHILDFGCGAGRTVYALRDEGYRNTAGFDVTDYLSLRDPVDRKHFKTQLAPDSALPYSNASFDLVVSEQVLEHVLDQAWFFKEMHRILRGGGVAYHVFPARYCPIEPHIYVPFGGVLGHRWWYKLWALFGVRNEFQEGLSADEVADRNAYYFVSGLNYVTNSCYEVLWQTIGFDYRWVDQENFDTSANSWVRIVGKVNKLLPILGWMNRTFHTRRVVLSKPK